MSVNIGPWVLDLAGLKENIGNNLVELSDELEHWVVGKVLEGELTLASVSGIGLTEDSMTVTGNDLARFKSAPHKLGELLVGDFTTKLSLDLGEPHKHFLVSQAVEGTGETVHASGE